jgi:hypothetical protein
MEREVAAIYFQTEVRASKPESIRLTVIFQKQLPHSFLVPIGADSFQDDLLVPERGLDPFVTPATAQADGDDPFHCASASALWRAKFRRALRTRDFRRRLSRSRQFGVPPR